MIKTITCDFVDENAFDANVPTDCIVFVFRLFLKTTTKKTLAYFIFQLIKMIFVLQCFFSLKLFGLQNVGGRENFPKIPFFFAFFIQKNLSSLFHKKSRHCKNGFLQTTTNTFTPSPKNDHLFYFFFVSLRLPSASGSRSGPMVHYE